MAEITRETLELAALAAGIFWDSEAGAGIDPDKPDPYGEGIGDTGKGGWWEPHLDDGDAARLQVRLNMWVDGIGNEFTAQLGGGQMSVAHHDGTEPDKLRAWREAVVLCAAAVGAKMKGGA